MTAERLYLFDTTLRDGQQTQGVDFSVQDKTRIATALDELGLDYVEGGWPGPLGELGPGAVGDDTVVVQLVRRT